LIRIVNERLGLQSLRPQTKSAPGQLGPKMNSAPRQLGPSPSQLGRKLHIVMEMEIAF